MQQVIEWVAKEPSPTFMRKISGYKRQDMRHEIFSEKYFIGPDATLSMLLASTMICIYCKCDLLSVYESMHPKQWTLDRIDNTMGHNKGNVVICCLQCNLRRRNISLEKFKFTNQLKLTRIGYVADTIPGDGVVLGPLLPFT